MHARFCTEASGISEVKAARGGTAVTAPRTRLQGWIPNGGVNRRVFSWTRSFLREGAAASFIQLSGNPFVFWYVHAGGSNVRRTRGWARVGAGGAAYGTHCIG